MHFKSAILDELGRKLGTDKAKGASSLTHHDYLRKYEYFLKPLKDENFVFMELGVFKGASLKLWTEYFSKARIVGVDIEEETRVHENERVKIILGDLSQVTFLEGLAKLGAKVILDDASHSWPDQLKALFVLYPSLPEGGIYILEDLHTSFQPLAPLFSMELNSAPFAILLKVAEYMTGNLTPAPILNNMKLLPLSPEKDFHHEVKAIADTTDALVFLERAAILIKK